MKDLAHISEEELVKLCIRDDRKAQEYLYRQHADEMFTVSMMYARDHDHASEILQKGFIKIFRSLSSFRFNGSLAGWIRRIVVNTALEDYRKDQRKQAKEEELKARVETVARASTALEVNDIIRAVNRLPEKAAMVLKLFAIEGYSHREISVMMDISEGTSKSQLNRARQLLRDTLDRHE